MRSKVPKLHDIVPLQTAMFMYKARDNLGPHNIQKRFQERERERERVNFKRKIKL